MQEIRQKKIKDVSDEMIAWKTRGTLLYQQLSSEMFSSWQVCEPLTEVEANRPSQEKLFETWKTINKT